MATIGPYEYQGCYTEANGARALSGAVFIDYTAMTLDICATNCAAFTYFGVEYGGECYCGNILGAGSVLATQTDCSFTCPGNPLEYCGAGNRLEMYKLSGSATSSSPSGPSATDSVTSTLITVTTSTLSSSSLAPVGTGFPIGWTNQGCWVDGVNGRILSNQLNDDPVMTLQSCANKCSTAGYTIAGMEYGQQCFCDNFVYNGGVLAASQADCNQPCAGNPAQSCGSGGRLTMYSKGTPTVFQAPGPQTTGLPTGWNYVGCLQDNIPSNENPNQILPTFPYKVWDNQVNTPASCIAQCAKFGYNAAGLEYGSQCFCGDVENIKTAAVPGISSDPAQPQSFTRSKNPLIVADVQCNSPCTGDKTHLCGSGNLLTYYTYNATISLYKWDFPTGTGAGQYQLLIGGVTVPLMTAQNINGKVSFVEKTGSGEANGTGTYELDLSLSNNFNEAWRTMTGTQTDVFCSAGLILPDKAGRQLTIGGWAGESNYGIRLYYPDGSAGVPGVNEWVEDKTHLTLQVPRWYPSALTMTNGSILIVGGEIGSNAAEQPTLELLPATGVPTTSTSSGYSNTTKYLDFLGRTAPFNLYPFVTVVPSGIFIAYYNEARILDEVTFETKKILPNLPGSIVDPTAGRTYQLEGSFVTLPQVAPYDKNMEVLICGGSTTGAAVAIDNCITTAPEDVAPVWTIERMPSRRVMPCMAGLPDGTYVILNGGQHGVAGFGLASAPNGNAVLYDPSKPKTQRMSVMANTTIARMYHSEAIVLLDGRVLVTGSDPTGDYSNPPGNFPEEHRVEVFVPPYLLSGLAAPTFTITNKDWGYNQSIHFSTGTAIVAGSLKVTLLGAVVSTHGNAMGQRTLVPAVTCTGTSCTVISPNTVHTAPPGWYMMFVLNGPTPSVGQYVRIGGDPAGLGNWPKLTGFQLPGI
ncbi:WSC domain-containing protein [Calycina marina]|uniref:WSC domain-containing protein n=1 Tax=Calycina marina TaxID=1763456 RepID=A0A9P8CD67_9HELO|nr:WSC domain-containing protein [Calycina marina]